MLQTTHYQHSGKAPIGGILMTLIGGLLAGVVLGAIYGFLIYWIPFVYINFFVTLGFGVGLAMIVGGLAKIGKIRNNAVVGIIALLVALLAYYVHWVVWVEMITETRITDPGVLWQLLTSVAEMGAWSIFGWTPKGFALYAIWGIEALMIIGLGVLSAVGMIDVPFCEQTGQWATEETLDARFNVVDAEQSLDSPGTLLGKLQLMSEPADNFSQVTVATADGSELRCVSLDNIVVERDKDGKEDLKKTRVTRNLLFDRDSFDKLMGMAQSAAA